MKRVIGFTHTDWDGVLSNVLFAKYYSLQGYDVTTVIKGYAGDDIDTKIRNYLKHNYQETDIIIVTDISMGMDMAKELDALPNKKIHLDHHVTNMEMLSSKVEGETDFAWSHVKEGDSATMLAYKYIVKDCQDEKISNIMKAYQPMVVATDLWDTKSRLSKEFLEWRPVMSNMLNLFDTIGWDKFRDRCIDNPSIDMNPTEQVIVKTMEKIKSNIIKGTRIYKLSIKYQDNNYVFGACFGGLYRSELAEYHCAENTELAFFIIIDMNKGILSYRKGNNPIFKNLDLTKIASQISSESGGHPFSCGGSFDLDNAGEVIETIFRSKFDIEL